jgi:hypothetical protein
MYKIKYKNISIHDHIIYGTFYINEKKIINTGAGVEIILFFKFILRVSKHKLNQ